MFQEVFLISSSILLIISGLHMDTFGTNQGVIESKVKVQVTRRSKTNFCDISTNLYPICMSLAPRCAELNSQKYGMPHNVVVCIPVFICLFVFMYVCYSYNSKSTGRNLVKFVGMIGHDPRNNRLVFGSDWVKGQGQGH